MFNEFVNGYKRGVAERKHYRHIDVPKEKVMDAVHHFIPGQLDWVIPFETFLHSETEALELTV